ncbi:hypothetical protein vBAbaMD22_152 [Acinetobacter phage vB_AbaM_D22]|nr:hypothetical protein vBAbaMD22_152 [Acinetobacter phage vB_AbaM_D22]
MKLNNHVHNRLKKRFLKKFVGKNVCKVREEEWRINYKYYELIKALKSKPVVEGNVISFLLKRLRMKNLMPCRDLGQHFEDDFSGFIIYDFAWSSTEEGAVYWRRMDEWIDENLPEFGDMQ